MPEILLFGTMLGIMLMRVRVPIGAQIAGKRVHEIRLSLWERLLLQRTNLYAIGFVLVLLTATGMISGLLELIVVGGALSVLAMPVRYIVTTDGIAINNVVFRQWSDFAGLKTSRRSIRLLPREGLRPFDVRILERNQAAVLDMFASRIGPAASKPQRKKAAKAAKRAASDGRAAA